MASNKQLEDCVTKFYLMAAHYAAECPALSRFYVFKAEMMKQELGLPEAPASVYCRYCGSIMHTDNHQVKVVPRMKVSRLLRKVIKRQAKGKLLGAFQNKVIQMYSKRCNRLVLTCQVCHQRTVLSGGDQPQGAPHKPNAKQLTTDSETNLSRNEKRKLKKKQQRRLKAQQKEEGIDSGLDLSVITSSSGSSSRSSSFSSLRSMTPQMTSTPLLSLKNTTDKPKSKLPKNPFSPLLSRGGVSSPMLDGSTSHVSGQETPSGHSLNCSDTLPPVHENSKKNGKQKRRKDNSVHNVLQRLFKKEKEGQAKKGNSLSDFLSSL